MRSWAPASCGEFAQGAIDGRDFLVNAPIDLYSCATVKTASVPGIHLQNANGFEKVQSGLKLFEMTHCSTVGHTVSLHSQVPRGKGMTSSSADLAAALSAVAQAQGQQLSVTQLSHLIAQVEPSDHVHLPGIGLVNHLTGEILESLPAPRDLSVVVVDCGEEVDTKSFDRERAREVYRQHQPLIRTALSLVRKGLLLQDVVALSEGATMSASLGQKILYKPQLSELLKYSFACGALGINCAHSGTVIGLLHRTSDGLSRNLQEMLATRFADSVSVVGNYRIITGGCHEY